MRGEDFDKLEQVAALMGDGARMVHTGGNTWSLEVRDPHSGRQVFYFGPDCGELIGYDRFVDDEHMSSGEIRVQVEAPVEVIAAEIRNFMGKGQRYHDIDAGGAS